MAKKTNRELIRELRERRKRAAFHDLTFLNTEIMTEPLSIPQKHAVEQYVRKHFELWWDSWVAPLIDEAEKRLVRGPNGLDDALNSGNGSYKP